jgi:hypothetical protein
MLLGLRILLGLCECVAFPCASKILVNAVEGGTPGAQTCLRRVAPDPRKDKERSEHGAALPESSPRARLSKGDERCIARDGRPIALRRSRQPDRLKTRSRFGDKSRDVL